MFSKNCDKNKNLPFPDESQFRSFNDDNLEHSKTGSETLLLLLDLQLKSDLSDLSDFEGFDSESESSLLRAAKTEALLNKVKMICRFCLREKINVFANQKVIDENVQGVIRGFGVEKISFEIIVAHFTSSYCLFFRSFHSKGWAGTHAQAYNSYRVPNLSRPWTSETTAFPNQWERFAVFTSGSEAAEGVSFTSWGMMSPNLSGLYTLKP